MLVPSEGGVYTCIMCVSLVIITEMICSHKVFFHCQEDMCVAGITDPRLCSCLNSRLSVYAHILIMRGWAYRPGTETSYVPVYFLNWVGCI